MSELGDTFDWSGDDADSVGLREQPATAIYQNSRGAIVIRQEASWDADVDSFVFVRPENAVVLAERIMALARDMLADAVGIEPVMNPPTDAAMPASVESSAEARLGRRDSGKPNGSHRPQLDAFATA